MTIDDELTLALLKPDKNGKVSKDAPIVGIVGTSNIRYELEELFYWRSRYEALMGTFVKMTPDIFVRTLGPKMKTMAIELENDIDWDFAGSLRQIKKYRKNFSDVRIVIPKKFERFASLYKNEGFRVYLWKAKRKWQCLRCGTITPKEGPIQPICKNKACGNKSRNEFRLVGLKDTKFEEYLAS